MNFNFNGIHIEKDGNIAPAITIANDTIIIEFSRFAILIQVEKGGRVNLSAADGNAVTHYTYPDVTSANKALDVYFGKGKIGQ